MRFRLPPFSRRLLPLVAAFAALATLTAVFLVPASARTAPYPKGQGWWTCGHDAHADVADDMEIRDNFSTGNPLCLRSSSWGDTFEVFSSSEHSPWGAFPNVFQGCENDGQSLPQVCTHGHARPVQVASIRSDASSASWYIPEHGTRANAAYDIWFNKAGQQPRGYDDGAEVMIWTATWGLGHPVYSRAVTIDGIRWGYATWRTSRGPVSWNYVRYWRLSGGFRSGHATLNLLDFFKDAQREGKLSPSWWLTGTEFGFEVSKDGDGTSLRSFTDSLAAR